MQNKITQVFVFKTDIKSLNILDKVSPVLNNQHSIFQWSVDLEDIDKVLRIEANEILEEDKVIKKLSEKGVECMIMTW